MKKKIVITFSACCDKCRTKALQTASMADGVISVALEGGEKEKLVVIGERVDAVCLTKKLRKKLSCADIVTVEEVKPPEAPKEPAKNKTKDKQPDPVPVPVPWCQGPPRCELVNLVYDPNPSPCSIM